MQGTNTRTFILGKKPNIYIVQYQKLKSGHETAKVSSLRTGTFVIICVAIKLPRLAVSWPLFVISQKRP